MALHPPLHPALVNILHREMVSVFHQTAELESAMQLHHSRMKVCRNIESYASWLHCSFYLRIGCHLCKGKICPWFDMKRHRGRCTLLKSQFPSISVGLTRAGLYKMSKLLQHRLTAEACHSTALCV